MPMRLVNPDVQGCSIIEMLKMEHATLNAHYREVIQERNPSKRKALFDTFAAELTAHIKAEEGVFYAVAGHVEGLHATIKECFLDHVHLADLLEGLVADEAGSLEFSDKLATLHGLFESHTRVEEEVVFRRMNIPENEQLLLELGEQFLELKAQTTDALIGQKYDRVS